MARIQEEPEVAAWLAVRIEERPRETFRQASPGRPTDRTRYVKHTRPAYTLSWDLQHDALVEAERDDGDVQRSRDVHESRAQVRA